MAATQATTGFGTLFQVGDGGGPEAFTTLAEVRSIDGPDMSLEFVDATHMESPSNFREIIPTFLDAGEVSVDVNFLPNHATQDGATGVLADWLARTLRNFKIVWPDAGNPEWDFAGYVTGFSPAAPFDDRKSAQLTVRISGAPTIP